MRTINASPPTQANRQIKKRTTTPRIEQPPPADTHKHGHDEICIQGPQQVVECGLRHLCAALLPLSLRGNPVKCKLYCADAGVALETAANLGCQEDTLIVIPGMPVGQSHRVLEPVASRVASTKAAIDKLMRLPLSQQEQHILLCRSLQHRADRLPRDVGRAVLQEPVKQLEAKVVAAMNAFGDLSDGELQPRQHVPLTLPHRHAGFGIHGV